MKFQHMTSAQLAGVDRERTLAIIPIAAVEQHGPHMPTGTDMILCGSIAEALEQRIREKTVVTPTFWLGASAHHLRFGATLDCELQNYIRVLGDLARSLLNDGFLRILFLNGHGGNVDPLRVAMRRLQSDYPQCLLAGGSYWSVAEDLIRSTLTGDHKSVGHACELETSLMLHLRPELVDADQLMDAGPLVADIADGIFLSRDMRHRTREGFTGRPDLASAEKGQQLFDGIVGRLQQVVEKLLAEPLGSQYHEFIDDKA